MQLQAHNPVAPLRLQNPREQSPKSPNNQEPGDQPAPADLFDKSVGALWGGLLGGLPTAGPIYGLYRANIAHQSGDSKNTALGLTTAGLNLAGFLVGVATQNPYWMIPAGIAGGILGWSSAEKFEF